MPTQRNKATGPRHAALMGGRLRTFGGRSLFDRPDLAVYIAAIANSWASIEAMLCNLMAYLISEPHFTATNRSVDPLGSILFRKLHVFNQRWVLLIAILESRLSKRELAEIEKNDRLKKLKTQMDRACTQRNNIVHAMWGVAHEHGDKLVQTTTYGTGADAFEESNLKSEDDLETILDEIDEARLKVEAFVSDVIKRKRIPD